MRQSAEVLFRKWVVVVGLGGLFVKRKLEIIFWGLWVIKRLLDMGEDLAVL